MAVSVVFNQLVTRGATFFNGDEWNMLLLRRAGWSASSFLEPNNQHITVLPTLVYKVIFAVAGGGSNVPQRIVVALLVCGCAGVVAAYLRPLVGWVPATCAGILVLFLGTGWEDLMWGFQMGFLTSLLGGIGALLVAARGPRHTGPIVLALLLAGALSSNVGLPMAVGAGVALVLHGRRRAVWAAVVPVVVWLVWFATYGRDGESNLGLDTVLGTPEYVLRSIAVACAGLSGLAAPLITVAYPVRGYPVGGLLGAGLTLLVLLAARRRGLAPGLVSAVVLALLYWATLALNTDELRPPDASRYLLPGAILTLLVLGESLVGLSPVVPARARRLLPAAAVVALALALVGNLHYYLAAARDFRTDGDRARAATGAMLLARATISPSFIPATTAGPEGRFLGTVIAGPLLAADRAVGTPADSEREIRRAGASARDLADVVAYAAGGPALAPYAPAGACTTLPAGGGSVALPPTGVALRVARGPLAIEVRRWSGTWHLVGSIPATAGPTSFSLTRRADAGRTPWRVRLRAPVAIRACAVER